MGILDQIAQPQIADIAGALDVRDKRLRADEERRKEIRMGQLIAEATPNLKKDSPLYNMAINSPKEYMVLSKHLGIPLSSGEQMQEFANDTNDLYFAAQNDPRDAYQRALEIKAQRNAQGRETPQIDRFIAGMEDDPQRTMTGLFVTHRSLTENDKNTPSGLKEFRGLTEGLSAQDKEKARRIELGLDARAIGSSAITTATQGLTNTVAQSEGVIEGAKAGSKENAELDARLEKLPTLRTNVTNAEEVTKGSVARRDLYKTQGLAAAENVPTLRRAIDLQDAINTGGGTNAIRKMANYLGVASQDEGELNSLFGQNILGQLKSTFGGNPTEGEREALEQAQASFSQTGKINSKLLKNALKLAESKIERGRRAAAADNDDATLSEIDAAMNVHLGDDINPRKAPPAAGATQETAAQRLERLMKNAN